MKPEKIEKELYELLDQIKTAYFESSNYNNDLYAMAENLNNKIMREKILLSLEDSEL